MCGLRWCWRTSPGVHLGLIVGQKQMFLPVYMRVYVCVCVCVHGFLHQLKECLCRICVCAAVFLTQMYLLLLKHLFVSVSVPDPLVSVCLLACSSVTASLHLCLLIFIFVLYSNTFKEVVTSCVCDPIYWCLHVPPSMCGRGMCRGKRVFVFLFYACRNYSRHRRKTECVFCRGGRCRGALLKDHLGQFGAERPNSEKKNKENSTGCQVSLLDTQVFGSEYIISPYYVLGQNDI